MSYKKPLIKTYLFLRRRVFGGKGLSRIRWIRNSNFVIEEFLKGKKVESSVVKNGVTIHLDPRQSVAEPMDSYEPQSTEIIKKYLHPGDVFVDVGASIGWFTLLAAKIVGEKGKMGKVYSFEPEPHSFALLSKNIAANHFEGVVVPRNAAVSDEKGTLKLFVVGDAYTWSSVEDPREDYDKNITANFRAKEDMTVYEHEVESIRLDDCLPAKVDFLKIDVEGATDKVFNGALKTIDRNPHMKLLIEHPTERIIKALSQRGYTHTFLDGLNGFFVKSAHVPAR